MCWVNGALSRFRFFSVFISTHANDNKYDWRARGWRATFPQVKSKRRAIVNRFWFFFSFSCSTWRKIADGFTLENQNCAFDEVACTTAHCIVAHYRHKARDSCNFLLQFEALFIAYQRQWLDDMVSKNEIKSWKSTTGRRIIELFLRPSQSRTS